MPFQILALSGGGYLGLFTAYILAELETAIDGPIASRFDLIAGTSIGGILALGLAAEVPAREMLEAFSKTGSMIFSNRPRPKGKLAVARDILRFVSSSKYDSRALRDTVGGFLEDRILGDARHRVLIPAVNMTKGSVQMFKTPHHEDFRRDYRLAMADIALATSAAPTYFPLAEIGDSRFIDGGVVANAPDLCALHEATHFLGHRVEDIAILSIGTTTSEFSLAHAIGADLGGFQWLSRQRLFSTIIAAQQQLTDYLVRHQLGDAYLRIDHPQSPEQQADLGLDVATVDATRTIRGMADGAYQKVASDSRLQRMLSHRATPAKFFYGPNATGSGELEDKGVL